jgi:hypothetical protein
MKLCTYRTLLTTGKLQPPLLGKNPIPQTTFTVNKLVDINAAYRYSILELLFMLSYWFKNERNVSL